jgi:hypothetical protein
MSAALLAPMTDLDNAELFRTPTGTRVHLRMCHDFFEVSNIVPASPDGVVALGCCEWTRNELEGRGRTVCDSIADGLAELDAPRHARAELARLLSDVECDLIYVPYSRSYLALSRGGRTMAWAGKTYVDYVDRPAVRLPDYVAGTGGGVTRPSERWGAPVLCAASNGH